MNEDFNCIQFNRPDNRKRMRYLIVHDGDLDLNGVIAFKSKAELRRYLKQEKHGHRNTQAVFKIEDITQEMMKINNEKRP